MSILDKFFGTTSNDAAATAPANETVNTSGTFSIPTINPRSGAGITTVSGGAGSSSGSFFIRGGSSSVSGGSTSINYLSQEENDELNALTEQYEVDLKNAKIAEFKKLPSDIRQFIINSIIWTGAQYKINNLSVNKYQRQIELESKSFRSGIYTSSYAPMYNNLPTGILNEELKQAHIDVSLEEQILEKKDE